MLNNQPTIYNGVLFPSKAEAKYAQRLDELRKEGRILSWRRQVPFKVYDQWNQVFTMIVDFVVMFEGRQEIHEVKRGYYSDDFKKKLALWIETYPYFKYYVVDLTKNGFRYHTPQDFLGIKDEEDIPVTHSSDKKHAWYEIAAAAILHFIGSILFK